MMCLGLVEAISFLLPVCAAAVTFGLIALAQPFSAVTRSPAPTPAHLIKFQPRKGVEFLS